MDEHGALAAIGDTPLIELDSVRPEGGARVYAKWEGANPTGSMKDRMALSMIRGARADGDLDPGGHVIEYTGGSTGSSLALVCGVLDHPLTLVTADCFATEKIDTMRALGAELDVIETPDGEVYPGILDDFRARVDALATERDAYPTDQFENEYNPAGYRPLGREIVTQCPDVADFVMAVGTGGAAMGTARGIHEERPDVRISVVEPAESAVLSGGDPGSHSIEGVALGLHPPFLEPDAYDEAMAIPEARAREMARQVARGDGLFAGTSTGLNVAAAVEVARERDPDEAVVTIGVDTGLKYLHGDLYR